MADLTFQQQLVLTLLDKGLVAIGLAVGGLFVSRAVERYKREQDVLSGIRRKQFEQLSSILDALGQLEALSGHFAESVRDGREQAITAMRERIARARDVIGVGVYHVGDDASNLALGIVRLLRQRMEGVLEGRPLEPVPEFYDKLNALRGPLVLLLPEMKPSAPWAPTEQRRAMVESAAAVLEGIEAERHRKPPGGAPEQKP